MQLPMSSALDVTSFKKSQQHAKAATRISVFITVLCALCMTIKLRKRKFFIAQNVECVKMVERKILITVMAVMSAI